MYVFQTQLGQYWRNFYSQFKDYKLKICHLFWGKYGYNSNRRKSDPLLWKSLRINQLHWANLTPNSFVWWEGLHDPVKPFLLAVVRCHLTVTSVEIYSKTIDRSSNIGSLDLFGRTFTTFYSIKYIYEYVYLASI